MTIILEAFSPADAAAIIRSDKGLRLCSPPYKESSTIALPENAIQDAVLNHDFHASSASFDNWLEVIDFLNKQLIAYRESCGRPVAETLNNSELLDVAPLEVLQGFLQQVENELIPQRQFEHAKSFLHALLGSNAIHEHRSLNKQVAKLLTQIQKIEESKTTTSLANKYSPFKNLPEMTKQKAAYIREYGFFGCHPERAHI